MDVGFAYDGDADRCLCVDEKGNVITGDHILYIYGCYMKERDKLLTNTVVTTVMSNFGLYKAFDEQGIGYAKTAVGDKYVYEYMAKNGCRIGGEQSGHIEFAKLTPGEAHFYDLNGDEIEKQTTEIKWDAEAAEKGGFEHFMMKEIHEQPKAVQDTLNSVIKNGVINLSSVEITEDEIKNFEQIYIVACGSAWHVGMAAQYVLEDMADIPVRVELASEFRYRKMPLNQNDFVKIS